MGRIDTENAKVLRQAMDVYVSVEETTDKPTSTSHTNCISGYDSDAKVTQMGVVVPLMDFANGGFDNDGSAVPIGSTLSSAQKYGYIASELADANGNYANAPTITINATSNWDYVTLTLCDSKGNQTQQVFSPTWSSGSCTITIDSFTANERLHIVRASLGKAWQFDNSSLISLTALLRGVNTDLEEGSFTLEGSEIELQAYVGHDGDKYVEIFSRMEKYSEMSFTCGYVEDMSDLRAFYLSEAEYDSITKCLIIKGVDATLAKLDEEYSGKYVPGTYANVRQNYYNTLKEMLVNSGISPLESGTVPSGSGSSASNLFFDSSNKREHIAKAVALYKGDDFNICYRDAGMPELISGDITTVWTINEEDVSEFTTDIEMNVNEYSADLFTYTRSSSNEEVATISEAVSGQTYLVSLNEPCYSVSTSGASLVSPYTLKYVASADGDVTIYGKLIKESTLTADNPRTVTDASQRGISVELGEFMKVPYDDGSLTANAMSELLDASNLVYTFKWRGNPHIKPYDKVQMKRYESGSRYIAENLYPAEDIYPLGAETILMRITSVSLEFEEGGLVSSVTARRLGGVA